MNKNFQKIIIFPLAFVLLFVLVDSVSAAADWTIPQPRITIPGMQTLTEPTNCTTDSSGNKQCSTTWIAQYVSSIYNYAVAVVGILAVMVMMFGGVRWIVSGGNASAVTDAKAWIASSLTGLILILSSYIILRTINPSLVVYDAFKLTEVEQLESDLPVYTSGGNKNTISGNVNSYDSLLKEAATKNGIDCTLLKAFMMTESSGNPDAVSKAGAVGLMQIMPKTAEGLGINSNNLKDPATSINGGAKYIKQLKSTACNGKTKNSVCDSSSTGLNYIIASYNGGPKSNKESKTCPGQTWWQCTANSGYQETRNYVDKVQSNYEKLQSSGWGC